MPKKKTVPKSKRNKKKSPPSKKAARRKKPAQKKRPAVKKRPATRAASVKTFEVDVVGGAPKAEEPELMPEEVDDDFPPDIGGSE